MSSDPDAETKQSHYSETLAALTAVNVAARGDILNRVSIGHVFDALQPFWRDQMNTTMFTKIRETARDIGRRVANRYGPKPFDPTSLDDYLAKVADNRSRSWENRVQEMLERIDARAADLVAEAAERTQAMADTMAELDSWKLTATSANFSALEAAAIEGKTTKTWAIQGAYTRPTHLAQAGLTIPITDTFPNGLNYPGGAGPPEETANCDCFLTFG